MSKIRKPFFLTTFFIIFSSSTARDTITPAQPLVDGETLFSAEGSFALGFFSPANTKNRYIGIWYNTIPVQTVVWVANREIPVTGSAGTLSITSTGTLLIADKNSTDVVWSSAGTTSVTNPAAQLLDNGNFVVREENSSSEDSHAWQSFDHPTDTLIAGMKVGVDLKTGLNRTLVSWKSESDPAPGQYYMSMDVHGDPQFFFSQGSAKLYRSGPWNGLWFSNIPIPTNTGIYPSLINNKTEITYFFITDKSIISRLVANYTGTLQRWVFVAAKGEWKFLWYAPRDQCDSLSSCGPNGLCDNTVFLSSCSCLPGFTPKSRSLSAVRDDSKGCVRMTPLDCRNGTDGFWTLSNAQLPDTSNATVDFSMTLKDCRETCLSNCSCTAYTAADVRNGGSGCIIWTSELIDPHQSTVGQNLYIRLAAADLGSISGQSHRSSDVTIAVTVSVISVSLLVAGIGLVIWRRRRRRVTLGRENSLDLPVYDFDTIAAATGNFAPGNKLGEGGFGPVYKGKIGDDEQDIAVKKLAKTSLQGPDEFKNEVTLIAKLQHRNLVRLLGCCMQGEEKMLIYEYMQNKSLDFFLFDKSRSAVLDWQTRYKIIVGIARGVLYLHQDSRFRIIHRDLKASNILLDKEMNPKISDFGMARIFGGEETEANTMRVVGTYGYMSPEYAMHGIFSVKSDVFSFGVLVLEIITGNRNRGVHLLGHVWTSWNEGNGLEVVDESMGNSFPTDEVLKCSFPTDEVLKCIKVGLLCVQDQPEDRPLMSSVVLMLTGDNVSLPHPKHPGFILGRPPLEAESSSSKKDSSSMSNDITISLLEGR